MKVTTAEWIQRRVDYAYSLLVEALESADPEGMEEAARRAVHVAKALSRHTEMLEEEEKETAVVVIENLMDDIAGYISMVVKLKRGEYEDTDEEEINVSERDIGSDVWD